MIAHGKQYTISKIEPMDADLGRSAFPSPAQLILRLLHRNYFVKLTAQA